MRWDCRLRDEGTPFHVTKIVLPEHVEAMYLIELKCQKHEGAGAPDNMHTNQNTCGRDEIQETRYSGCLCEILQVYIFKSIPMIST